MASAVYCPNRMTRRRWLADSPIKENDIPVWKGIVGRAFTADEFATHVSGLSFVSWRPFVVLHNTAVPTFAQWHSVPGEQRMQNLQSYYRDTMKWSGGPHVFVAADLLSAFTPLTVPGVHSPSWNNVPWGVELVGDYSTEQIVPGLKANAISALATLHGVLGIDPSTLRLHREDQGAKEGGNAPKQKI